MGIPSGFVIGHGISALICAVMDSDLLRLSLVVSRQTYAFASSVSIVISAVVALTVIRHLSRLDLTAVLKTKE